MKTEIKNYLKLLSVIVLFSITLCIACSNNNEVTEESPVLKKAQKNTAYLSDTLYDNIELPIKIDSSLFRKLSDGEFKQIYDLDFFNLTELKQTYNDLPVYLFYSLGKFEINDTVMAYVVLTDMNQENSVDMYFMSASLVLKNGDKILDEKIIAKYHAYSGIIEEHYVVINSDFSINQDIRFRGDDGIGNKIDTVSQHLLMISNNRIVKDE